MTLIEKGRYKVCWFGKPERHFIVYMDGIEVLNTKYEKEAFRVFNLLLDGKKWQE